MDYAIGIDLGGTQIKFLAVTPEGDIIHEESCETADRNDSVTPWSDRIRTTILHIEQTLNHPAQWVGLSAPGMANREKRKIISLPGRLNGLENLDWTDFLQRQNTVTVLNDAHAALYGESWKGSASNYKNVIFLTLGTGVGGAFSIDGKLQTGFLGRAGHFGHTCLNLDGPLDIKNSPGSIELMIGECTVKERTNSRFNSNKDLLEAHLDGDQEATIMWERSIYALACAIASFINILDPEVVLLGGGVSKAGDHLLKPLNHFMNKVEWRPEGHQVPIKFAKLGNKAGALGAARYAMLHSSVSNKEHALVS